ncbi:type I secretion system permease/ATPase [Erythrobacter sp. 3-20A1M]|uniref:type I secretion system permease/ATPase n=1 Tax=Erythrobacter sp. 3-20A1M TaxID=2653850 RepID=UPI001BFCB705|nr:type I secretion system permease/ATPase [Erythrobacter sp. 3-20A1M]QWC56590.1 type I secretion system permease/ATPase [Erythrobacter sp. 3-20A1M]
MTLGKELKQALRPLRPALVPIVLISAVLNVLMLGGSFFMLLVYDEVLPSRSVPTLIGLLGIIIVVYLFLGGLDYIRSRIMVQLGTLASSRLSKRVLDLVSRYELSVGPLRNASQPIRDLDQIRSFLSSAGPLAFLDLPWVLLFLGVLFLFHWSLGLLALFGVITLVILMIATDRMTSRRVREVAELSASRYTAAENIRRGSETLQAMGMMRNQERGWLELERDNTVLSDKLARTSGGMTSLTKGLRMFLQSLVLALGAYLVIQGEATGGIIIAGSILSARALAPIEQTIAQWKSAVSSVQALRRLGGMFDQVPERTDPTPLPLPTEKLEVISLVSGPPGMKKVTIGNISFSLQKGDALAVVGRSGSGKSSLVRAICGIWPALQGHIRLDGATLDQWAPETLGSTIGYVPQSIDMFPGTVAQNISRFEPDAAMEDILAAAREAGLHDFIVRLDGGYDHMLGPQGGTLSAGQMQRLALARALYKNPFLLVLDEPNSNLDADGERALVAAIEGARARGAIVIVVAHRPSILTYMSHVLVMNAGRLERFSTTEESQFNVRKISANEKQLRGQA